MYRYSLGMYEKAMPDSMPLEEKMRAAKEAGFDHLELCVDLNEERAKRLEWADEEVGYWLNKSREIGLPFTSFSLSLLRRFPLGTPDDRVNEQSLDIIRSACRLAVGLGSRIMLINGYDVYDSPSTEETRTRFFQTMERALSICAEYGVMVGIENAERPFCKTIQDGVDICRKLPSPYLAVYGDIANATIAAEGDAGVAVRDILSGRGYLAALHLKDALPGQYRFHDFGRGMVDFDRCIRAAKAVNVHLFTAEIFCDEKGDPLAYAGQVARGLRGYLDRED